MSIDKDFFEVEGISLDGYSSIYSGVEIPSVMGVDLPIGSLYLCTNGSIFKKFGSNSTEWAELSTATVLEELVVSGPFGPELVFTDDEVIKIEVI